jgi:putative phage-type endonuclease
MDNLQWLEWRKKGLGASDAPIVMGVSKFKSLDALRKEKLFGISTQKETAAMRRGKEMESEALRYFMGETGYFLEEQKCYEHPERNWMRCTVDGINEEEKVLVEAKVPTGDLYDEVPPMYYPQCQHLMEVLSYKKMYFLSYNEKGGKILEVPYDVGYINKLIKKEQEFWDEIQSGFKKMESVAHWKKIKDDLTVVREALKASEELYKESIKELKERENFLLSDALLFTDGVPATGNGLTLYRKARQGAVDAKKIKNETGVDLELYRKEPIYTWSLLLDENPTDLA